MSNTISSKDGPFAETGNSKFETDKLFFISKGRLFHLLINFTFFYSIKEICYKSIIIELKKRMSYFDISISKERFLTVTIAVPNPTDREPAAPYRNMTNDFYIQLIAICRRRAKRCDWRRSLTDFYSLDVTYKKNRIQVLCYTKSGTEVRYDQ
ncbi:hypothetical protein ALC53_03049 [Atta colombica]|uniref:Uncharacterized protein n=1 Tax=Atta colombica TaxID=520822 RepID=A0A195BRJ6_9HYME|nr:hypothetical protein ALC53_03049 [Atta colombica]